LKVVREAAVFCDCFNRSAILNRIRFILTYKELRICFLHRPKHVPFAPPCYQMETQLPEVSIRSFWAQLSLAPKVSKGGKEASLSRAWGPLPLILALLSSVLDRKS
jgi:hypothetical protein